MMKRWTYNVLFVFTGIACIFLSSCSSAPKGPRYIFARANEAADFCRLGRDALRLGDRTSARSYYCEAYRIYTLVDDAEGRIRALDGLTLLGEEVCETEDNTALAIRIAANYRDNGNSASLAEQADTLAALAVLIDVRCKYLSGPLEPAALRSARTALSAAATTLRSRPDDRARALRLEAELAASMEDYAAALTLLDEAASIWSKPLSLVEYANTRYLTASVLSRMGRLDEAYAALLEALDHDRKAENSVGLAESCHALALVARKRGDTALADRWERRSREIYRALSLGAETAAVEPDASDAPLVLDADVELTPAADLE